MYIQEQHYFLCLTPRNGPSGICQEKRKSRMFFKSVPLDMGCVGDEPIMLTYRPRGCQGVRS